MTTRLDTAFLGPTWVETARRLLRDNGLALTLGAIMVWLVGAPIIFLVRMSFSTGRPANPGHLTLANYSRAFHIEQFMPTLGNTVVYSVGVSLVSMAIAITMAWLVERTDMPMRNLVWAVMLLPLAMPGFLSSISYVLLLAPKSGIINQLLRPMLAPLGFSGDEGPINIYSMYGMIFVEGIRGATTIFLMIVAAFRLMDPSLEDAAIMSGAGRLETLRTVTIPLLTPALLGALVYAFVGNLQDFDTPLVLGLPAGIMILPTLIYFVGYSGARPNLGVASVYATLFVVLMVVLTFVYYRYAIRGSRRFATVLGKGYRPQRIKLGGLRYAALAAVVAFAVLSVILPFLTLLWTSVTQGAFQMPTMAALRKADLSAYADLFGSQSFLRAAWNTIGVSLLAGVATMGLAMVSAWAVVRLRVRGAALLDTLAFIPNAVPSVALGMALVVFYLGPIGGLLPIYGTWALLIIAFVINYVAFATRLSNGAMAQLGPELEEAAWTSGHGKFSTLVRVTTPLLSPAVVAGMLWIVAHAARNLTLPLMLASQGTETLSMHLWNLWDHHTEYTEAAAIGVIMMVAIGGLALFARSRLSKNADSA